LIIFKLISHDFFGDINMIKSTDATAEIFLTAFRAMPRKERSAIIDKLLKEKEFTEDIIDLAILKKRENEPSTSIDEYIAKKNRRVSDVLYCIY
jgi:hypothetical protein